MYNPNPARRGQTGKTVSVPAPTRGLNSIDSVAAMNPSDAIVLDNWFPSETGCVVRPGYAAVSTGLGASVETVCSYIGPTTSKLFGFAGTTMYDASSTTPVAKVTGLTNARWQTVNFSNSGGAYLIAVNGSDVPIIFNGTDYLRPGIGIGAAVSSITRSGSTATLTTSAAHGLTTGMTVTVTGATQTEYNVTDKVITVTGTTTFTYAVTGSPATPATGSPSYTYKPFMSPVTSASIIDVAVYARRIWGVEKDTFSVWYGATDAISGTFTEIDMGPLFSLGGYLNCMIPWAIGGDTDSTGYACFLSSEGEVAVYAGEDPSTAATWELKGVYRTGKPIGRRCWVKYGGDVLIMTDDGVFPLSQIVLTDRRSDSISTSKRITGQYNEALIAGKSTFGWDICFHPLTSKLFVNVPNSDNGFDQYVMNSNTGAWCRYTGINAKSWCLYGDSIIFGGSNGNVYAAETGYDDAGDSIQTDVVTAFSNFGVAAQKKYTMCRPTLISGATFSPSIGLMLDYSVTDPVSTPSVVAGSLGAEWDVSPWDSTPWGTSAVLAYARWLYVGGIGFTAALRMKTNTKYFSVTWAATDIVFEPGGVL